MDQDINCIPMPLRKGGESISPLGKLVLAQNKLYLANVEINKLRSEMLSVSLERDHFKNLLVDGAEDWAQPKPKQDNTLIKAIVSAKRWQKMLEDGKMPSSRQLAEREKTNPSYLARILRLTLLAPDIVEAILNGRKPKGLLLADLLKPFPVEWDRQRALLGFTLKVY